MASSIWRKRLTPGQAWLVAQATHGLRAELGYLDEPTASRSSIVAASLREARVRFREARSSTGVIGAARHAGSVLKTLSDCVWLEVTFPTRSTTRQTAI